MTDADYEYLLRTLSEAQARAAEIAVSVRGHVGVDHRLSELGNSAVAQIETVLRDMRRVASEESGTAYSEGVRPAREADTKASTGPAKNSAGSLTPSAQEADLASEHWFPAFVTE